MRQAFESADVQVMPASAAFLARKRGCAAAAA